MHGKTHKGQTIHSCTDCEFSANTSQQLDDHMNKHRGTRPFQCSECGLMFAARADLRAHVTRTHRNASTTIQITTNTPATINRRPQRRQASLQHRYIGVSSTIDDDDEQQHDDDDDNYRCTICQRQFTSVRLLNRHTYAVHESKQQSYTERNSQRNEINNAEEDDVHDYADDELEEKDKNKIKVKNENIQEKMDDDYDEEEDLAAHVEDIVEGDDEIDLIPTIKSVSSANKNKRKVNINRRMLIKENKFIFILFLFLF
jgi:stress-induced morphogen